MSQRVLGISETVDLKFLTWPTQEKSKNTITTTNKFNTVSQNFYIRCYINENWNMVLFFQLLVLC